MAETDSLELKKRARRRLVGSIALALFAAIVLPMVMDREPVPGEQDIQVRIPGQESVSPAKPAAANPETPPDSAAGGDSDTPAATPPVVAPQPQPKPEPRVLPPAVKAESKPEVKPEPRPEHKEVVKVEPPKEIPKPKPVEVPKPVESPASSEAARVEALLEGRAPAPSRAPAASSESMVVQLGAYRDHGNALALRDKIKAAGFPAYAETLGDKTRVRVGPYASREAAGQAAEHLAAKGFKGVVTSR